MKRSNPSNLLRGIPIILWLLLLFFLSIGGGRPFGETSAFRADEVVVRFRSPRSPESEEIRQRYHLETLRVIPRLGVERLATPPGTDILALCKRLSSEGAVAYAEPNYIYHAEKTPNDPLYPKKDDLPQMAVDRAWNLTTGSRDVIVGVLDQGVTESHPDLAANMWVNRGEIAGNGRDDDRNGYVDDLHGWDFVDENADEHVTSHGTHVAGIIGAVGNNHEGLVGVNWRVSLMWLRFLDSQGAGTMTDAAEAIVYAVENGARIINGSWGGIDFSQTLYDAIAFAGDAGVLYVASAGNDGEDGDDHPHYPSGYDLDDIIAVASVDGRDRLASSSNYGCRSVDVAAPGVEIYSTILDNDYAPDSGTSMAAPQVAGVAALLLSARSDLDVQELKDAIMTTVDPIDDLEFRVAAGGRVNAYRALQWDGTPFTPPDCSQAPGPIVCGMPGAGRMRRLFYVPAILLVGVIWFTRARRTRKALKSLAKEENDDA